MGTLIFFGCCIYLGHDLCIVFLHISAVGLPHVGNTLCTCVQLVVAIEVTVNVGGLFILIDPYRW